jgi:hypothetical protein
MLISFNLLLIASIFPSLLLDLSKSLSLLVLLKEDSIAHPPPVKQWAPPVSLSRPLQIVSSPIKPDTDPIIDLSQSFLVSLSLYPAHSLSSALDLALPYPICLGVPASLSSPRDAPVDFEPNLILVIDYLRMKQIESLSIILQDTVIEVCQLVIVTVEMILWYEIERVKEPLNFLKSVRIKYSLLQHRLEDFFSQFLRCQLIIIIIVPMPFLFLLLLVLSFWVECPV